MPSITRFPRSIRSTLLLLDVEEDAELEVALEEVVELAVELSELADSDSVLVFDELASLDDVESDTTDVATDTSRSLIGPYISTARPKMAAALINTIMMVFCMAYIPSLEYRVNLQNVSLDL